MAIKKITTTIYKDDETQQEYQFEPIDDTIELKPTDITSKKEHDLTCPHHPEVIRDGQLGECTCKNVNFELRYLTQDENPESPDAWENTDCFLVHYHRDFQIENEICPKDVLGYIYTRNADAYDKDTAEQVEKDYWVFPVSAYIHSGVSLSLDDGFRGRLAQGHYQFDVSHVGAVLAAKEDFKTKDKAKDAAAGLVETWNQYLSGDVYCLVCEKLDKDKQSIDFDTCGGYYGLDYAKESLKTEI